MMERVEGEPKLEATGERLVPELQHGEVVHAEHLVRYNLAAQFAEGRRVLDAACGEGYGSALLSTAGARSVTGIDLDESTIAHARARYPTAEFVHGDIRRLPFEDGSFELVVSFETIEHVTEPERVLDELSRVMADEGLLVISTPNKHQYLVENAFHEREFTHEQFVELLSARFPSVQLLLQHNWLASAVLSPELARDASGAEVQGARFGKLTAVEPGGELYTVAACGRRAIPATRPVVIGAGLDEAHELARRLVAAERTAARWHDEFLAAKQTAARWHDEFRAARQTADSWHDEYNRANLRLLGVYGSIWWRMTAPLRWLADSVRRRSG